MSCARHDMDPPTRDALSEATDGNHSDHNVSDAEHSGYNGIGDAKKRRSSSNLSTDDNYSSASPSKHEDMSRDALSIDDHSVKSGDDSDGAESTNGKNGTMDSSCVENDSIWIPPEAADKDDEAESVSTNIAYDDDDDDYGDGIKWGQSSFPATNEEEEASTNPRDERENAMLDAMNGQLKILVSRFLASAGISFSKGESGESWLDILTSLSWEAALLIKPDASEGKEMDPGSYIKVKCIASGTRRQSEVIKGLVFKKNAAHKHMPTSCHNPRLLLLKGVLGHSDVGLSSFNSMDQEKDHLERAISKMMEICSPNVILVEKTVSRDIQELLLKEGVTLILDMKLNRLKRIARCTGSPIISFSEVLDRPKLKRCDSFHIEKFIEDHNNVSDGGKRLSKTLMFLEGFPRPLGCTILLRGANSEELKKIKQVMHYTVFAAYHLILETSFFEDQRIFLNDQNASRENSVTAMAGPSANGYDPSVLGASDFPSRDDSPALRMYSTTSNGYVDARKSLISSTKVDSMTNSSSNEFGESASIRHDSKPPLHSERSQPSVSGSLSKYVGRLCHQNIYLPVTSLQETSGNQIEGEVESGKEIVDNGFHVGSKVEELAVSSENVDLSQDHQRQEIIEDVMPTSSSTQDKPEGSPVRVEDREHQNTTVIISKEKTANEDQADDALDSHSILILMSSQCITKQSICEQSHLSRIKYYGNFDVSLGRYLQDILQNQKLSCSSCGEPPESHLYSYTHRNGNLTVLVKYMAPQLQLPGGSEGKIWMWTRCLRCENEHGVSKSTPRVLISSEARNLSFGKFLELSFSSHSAARRLSICGHLVNRDCLRFFGLGSKVAMFRYSSVEIYTTCKPQTALQFDNPCRQDWFKEERRYVLARGIRLFSDVALMLQHLKDRLFDVTTTDCIGSPPVKDFSELEELLIKEKAYFEDSLEKTIDQNGRLSESVRELLDINWSYQDLLLELYVWDHRLDQLFKCASAGQGRAANCKDPVDTAAKNTGVNQEAEKKAGELICDRTTPVLGAIGLTECPSNYCDHQSVDIAAPMLAENQEADCAQLTCTGDIEVEVSSIAPCQLEVDSTSQTKKIPSFEISDVQGDGVVTCPISKEQELSNSPNHFRNSGEGWFWNPFHECQLDYRNDIQNGFLEKFELVNHYSPSHISCLFEQHEDMSSPQFTVGPGGNILSVLEDEISSIIARALVISEERHETEDSRGEHAKAMEKSYSFLSESSLNSSAWSSIGSSDSDASFLSFGSSVSSDDLSGYDNLPLFSSVHPEIIVNGKVALRGKYSVTSIYAKQFHDLRKKCCPSELAYITSLSRCKKWNAQGGKSKAFFAKTVDDRFIIKQIKKTEFESFIKFAPDYFKHVYHSLDTGSQTCLAKILGIYQVKQTRHGKEVKIDLMVMENLLFGHNISRIYDLKGAIFSRHVAHSNDRDTVYLDQNYVEDMRVSPIYIGGRTKHLLQRAIWNDTSFLTSVNVMDYSLLVGVDKQKNELVFGIIDYLRQYTWDKQLETWVKTSLVVPKNVSPTVVSPKEYKKRFRKFMAKYFLTVPDTWGPENSSGPSKSFGHNNNMLVEVHSDDNLFQHPTETEAVE
ncbi:putative 1-phosphatidylinositol-3-phosphate 5-kinase FAB1D [Oryza brachyantha]|uniref:1-phosphatidylinositol-3-phosphate 5-kinase n=1 Tax=Oryza brachyantha TaxID=4533 RepID=J3MPL3_ORYBR|nr:putative 1-phosphatidylinositol-3-phosphate 5-kinase FAB1D [Oryza brachyantha]